jgi:hypothetical protein
MEKEPQVKGATHSSPLFLNPEGASGPPAAAGFFEAASFAASLPPNPCRRFWNTGMLDHNIDC